MKKVLSVLFIASLIISFGSCTKEVPNGDGQSPFYVPDPGSGTTEPEPTAGLPVGDVPGSFTKKVVIEKLTGEWCGACPSGSTTISGIMSSNPGKVYSVEHHMANGEPFQIPASAAIRSHLALNSGNSSWSFPSATVNRTQRVAPSNYSDKVAFNTNGSGVWAGRVATQLAKTADCGLALDVKEANDVIDMDVYIGYNSAVTTPNTKITVYLLENNVPESSPGAQASGGGNYMHQHVLRDVLTADLGDEVNLGDVPNKHTKVELKGINISGKYDDKSNLVVLAFVNVAGADGGKHDVLNAQEAHLNEIKMWD